MATEISERAATKESRRPPRADLTLDFFERLRENVRRLPEHVAMQGVSEAGRESFTYRQVGEEVARISRFLQSSGIGPGDQVGILLENHPRWGIAFLAVQSAGAVVVPFDILHDQETLAELIQHAECKFLISSQKLLSKFEEIQKLLPRPLPALVAAPEPGRYTSWDEVLTREGYADATAEHLPLVNRDLEEPLLILYTSGTTGNPKGVVLTGRNVYRNVVELLTIIKANSDDHILSVLPLYHVLALMTNFIIPLYIGGRVTYLDVLEAQRILKAFQEEGITIFVCVPQFYYLVHRRIFQEVQKQFFIKRWLFHALFAISHSCNRYFSHSPAKLFFAQIHRRFGPRFRFFGVGGARFDSQIESDFRDLGFTLVQAYGMTETAALITVTPPGTKHVGSVGKPLPHVQIHIDQPDEHGIGEVLIRGENIMEGYWKNSQATREAIEDEWLHSGDLGYLTPDGYLHITGRKKDVIVLSSGKNIYPEEIEHFYQSNCPYIKELCIIGSPDPETGTQERLHAVVVPDFDYLKSKQVVNAYDAIRYEVENLSQQLPPYKRIRSFSIRSEPLPRTTTRKVQRFQVQKELLERPAGAREKKFAEETRPESPTEEKVFELIRQMKKRPIHREMNLELDLEFDSLERVELLSNVEETFQIHVPDDKAAQILTVKELVDAVEEHLSGEVVEEKAPRSWADILQEPLASEEERKVHPVLQPRPVVELIFYLVAKLVYVLSKVLFRLQVTGRENLPRAYPYLVCPNHLSYVDVFVVVGALPYHVNKRIFFLGYSEYFSGPVMSVVGRLIKVIPVDADRYLRQALRLAAEGLRQDLLLCVFPEGERSIDGTLKQFRKGPAILATELQVPVVPVGIIGTYEVWRRGSSKFRLHPVSVHFGEPLKPPFSRESYDQLNDSLFQAVKRLTEKEDLD